MYQIVCVDNGTEHTLMDMADNEYVVDSPILTLELNGAGTLTFTIYPNHPEFGCIKTLTSIVRVYRVTNGVRKWIFTGRVMTSENDIKNTGKIECEGILAYLCDSIVRPYEFKGTPADFVTYLIESHNNQVDEDKRFTIEDLDVSDADSNNYITRANSNYPNTLSELNDKAVKLLNTYISAREDDNGIYFSCVQSITHLNPQPINFGENIMDLTRIVSAEEIRTVMIGIGASDDDGNKPTVVVENTEAIKLYGRIEGTVEFENVTTTVQLEKKTRAYLDSVCGMKSTLEVKALDLNMTDEDMEELSLGYAYVTSANNEMDNELMLISKMQIYLMKPENNIFTLGSEKTSLASTLVHSSADISNKVQQVEKTTSQQIESKVANATQLITGSKGGYVVIDTSEESGKPEQILVMDAPEKDNAKNVIRLNKNGIGFSTSGYDGIYRNAWTIDGNLVADFITAGTMSADRIEGGTLTLGGKDNTYGSLIVKDANSQQIGKWDKDGIVLPSNATIAWSNVSGKPSNLATTDDVPTTDQITVIANNAITTAKISANQITAGTLSGITIKSMGVQDYDGQKLDYGFTMSQGVLNGYGYGVESSRITFRYRIDSTPAMQIWARRLGIYANRLYVPNDNTNEDGNVLDGMDGVWQTLTTRRLGMWAWGENDTFCRVRMNFKNGLLVNVWNF